MFTGLVVHCQDTQTTPFPMKVPISCHGPKNWLEGQLQKQVCLVGAWLPKCIINGVLVPFPSADK